MYKRKQALTDGKSITHSDRHTRLNLTDHTHTKTPSVEEETSAAAKSKEVDQTAGRYTV